MDRDAKVKGLVAAAAAVAVGKPCAQGVQDLVPGADRLAFDQLTRVFQGVADFLAAGDFAHAGAAGAVGQYQQVAGEERGVGAAQVEQHAVLAGNRNHLHAGDAGRLVR
jgi:hypothetical protein